jgi:hypothetical protein
MQDPGVTVALLYISYKKDEIWMSRINAGSYTRSKYEHTQGNGLTCVALWTMTTIKRKKSRRPRRASGSGHGVAAHQSSWRQRSAGKQIGCVTWHNHLDKERQKL